jgi:hypothetical protein
VGIASEDHGFEGRSEADGKLKCEVGSEMNVSPKKYTVGRAVDVRWTSI